MSENYELLNKNVEVIFGMGLLTHNHDELFEKKFVCDLQKCKYVSFGFKETTF